jgi:hypothetical protein
VSIPRLHCVVNEGGRNPATSGPATSDNT